MRESVRNFLFSSFASYLLKYKKIFKSVFFLFFEQGKLLPEI